MPRLLIALCAGALAMGRGSAPPPGIFFDNTDIGKVLHAGSVEFNDQSRTYTVTASGENMWAAADDVQFVWKKVPGDVTLSADISFLTQGGNAHKKAVLMIRQSLDADSAYADAALHGNGLTSLQSREAKGAATHEIQSNVSAPRRLSISKRGDTFYMKIAAASGQLEHSGGAMRVPMQDPFYVGIAVCAHDKDAVEKAAFSNVDLTLSTAGRIPKPVAYSTLETVPVASTDRRVTYTVPGRIEAPNWSRDGVSLLFNANGRIQRIPVDGGRPEPIDTGFAVRCNSSHGLSPDGRLLAISDESRDRGRSIIYVVLAAGGAPRRVTSKAPSFWHAWSPDGSTLLFVGIRKGKTDVYGIPAAGGKETRLTTAPGRNEGPDYSPDGRYIYFSSDRTGTMQIWRMKPDGTEQEQVTDGESDNRYPHVSPDGRQLAFLTSGPDVLLRVMSLADRRIRNLGKFQGGPGTIDVPSWSPDSRRLAFVSYQLLEP
jgi:TolB protein